MKEYFSYFANLGVGSVLAVIAFFLSRTFGKIDSSEKGVIAIWKAIGLMQASDDRSWEQLDPAVKEIQALRERVLVLETLAGVKEESENES